MKVLMLQPQLYLKMLIMVVTFHQAISTIPQFVLQQMVVKIFALLATKSFMLQIPLQLIIGTTDHKQSVVTLVLVVPHQSGLFLVLHQLKNSIFIWLM
jgi:hypothetical protein